MGNRDRPGRNQKKPKKKEPGTAKPLSLTIVTAPPTTMPELVRKKKRQEAF